jgi:hypothetical protein
MTTTETFTAALVLLGTMTVGIEVGERRAAQELATVCRSQPGERLVSTLQRDDGVVCTFAAPITGRTLTQRKATRT